jgi:hypothetical protein
LNVDDKNYEPIKNDKGEITHVGPPIVNNEGLIEAIGVPTGFMKIRKSVFTKLAEAYPDDWLEENGKKEFNFFGHLKENNMIFGEDMSFCRRWRSIGGKLWVEPRCNIGHWGVNVWGGNYDAFLKGMPTPIRKAEACA